MQIIHTLALTGLFAAGLLSAVPVHREFDFPTFSYSPLPRASYPHFGHTGSAPRPTGSADLPPSASFTGSPSFTGTPSYPPPPRPTVTGAPVFTRPSFTAKPHRPTPTST
ncbi:hypothetical protein B2J93_134 [Marssonina coronariae]|uniref:Uncharacterized protein n=1 Tax=Diplocarpon coronariae TaxID=2795749 RepID=A0A218Z3X4_9HELO|nr:hypothetical protein B2J93_134 [Marssonina coronariae]